MQGNRGTDIQAYMQTDMQTDVKPVVNKRDHLQQSTCTTMRMFFQSSVVLEPHDECAHVDETSDVPRIGIHENVAMRNG